MTKRHAPGKPCQHCGKDMTGMWSYGKRKFCGVACDKAAIRAKGPERFWAKVDKTSHPGGCWLYMGFRKWDGYGWLARHLPGREKVKYLTAHRYAWILTHGEPTNGLHVLHKCDNPPCCNPSHLQLGTHQDNMADMLAKGRSNGGFRLTRKPSIHPGRVRPRRAA